MKGVVRLILTSLSLIISISVMAADLSIPHQFSAGQPAVAAEVNANFDAVENVVNTKQDRLSATDCADGQLLQGIDAAGAGRCVYPAVEQTEYLSLPGEAFVSAFGSPVSTSVNGAYPTTVNAADTLVAVVYLPNHAQITSFTVWLEDAAPGAIVATLLRRSLSTADENSIATLSTAGVYSAGIQSYESVPLSETVNNADYGYVVRIHSDLWPGSMGLRVVGARISYTR